ncbi:sensor histidine kinase [Alkaliphilus peptidifermentans]|uniref:Sensor_kinase_SpoOB-type, alpha-helical domain n=1 Tax=Alkaliphilus peptidifermentans DSM 18978 TaxID=1120976 RepID=A0A1G5GGC8_9FIRM|nr:GHKL domain-containing protein [Alkaliphilus peptidifermentans]SCY50626.1 Sensor_kinase_SpoOB-type, alpha-helical domain [Alkaliphilus peptidifermentans DSM 18978]
MEIIITNFVTSTIDTFLIYYSVQTLLKKKVKLKYVIPTVFVVIFLSTFLNITYGLANLKAFIGVLILSSILYSIILKSNLLHVSLLALISSLLMFLAEILSINIIVIIFSISPTEILSVNYYKLIAIISSKTGFLLVIYFVLRRIDIQKFISRRDVLPITAVLFFNMIISYMTFLLYKHLEIATGRDYISLLGMAVGAIIFSWLVFMLMKRMMDQNERELLWSMREKEYQNQRIYFSNLEEILKTMKAQRHDFNNHISIIYGMLQLGKNKEAGKYIKELGESVSELNEIVQANHPVITALINVKKQKASKEGIEMDLDIELPEELSFDYIDISIILGNLLDNAIEASRKTECKEIDVRLYLKGNYMIINIMNTKSEATIYQESDNDTRYTSKEDSDNHGFGLMNVKQVVYRYKGIIKIEDKGELFEVNIALPLMNDVK